MRLGNVGAQLLDRLVVELGADADLKGMDKFERAADNLLRKMDKLAGVALGVGAAAAAGVAAAVMKFAGLDAKIAEVAAKTGLTMEELKTRYFDDLRAIQRETGATDFALWDGLQKAISAGVGGEEALELVRASAMSAAAGIGEISDQVSSATTLMGQFKTAGGLALDVIARAAQVGEGETEDFSQALKGLGAVGSAVGLGLYDVAAGMASISRSAKSVAEGETQFRAFLTSMSGRSRVGAELLEEMGLSFEKLREIGESRGLAAMVETLQRAVGDDIEKMQKILGSVEALQFVLNTDTAALEGLTADLRETAPGTIFRAMAEGAELSTRKLAQLRRGLGNILEDVGKHLDPLFGRALDLGLRFTDALLAMPDGLKKVTAHLLLLTTALVPIGGAVKMFTAWRRASGLLQKALKGLAGGVDDVGGQLAKTSGKARLLGRLLPLALNPAGLIAAGLLGLTAILLKWDEIKGAVRRAWFAVKEFFSASRRRREATEGALEASRGLVTALERQLELLREQSAPAEAIAGVEARITAEKARQVELQRALKAEAALEAVKLAAEVTLPGLGDELEAARRQRAITQRQLDVGTRSGRRGGQGSRRLTPEQRVERENRVFMLDAEIAGLETKFETARLEASANFELLAGGDVDPRLRAAGGAAALAFGEAFRASAPELQREAMEGFSAAFDPILPSSDARRGVFAGLTRAGEAIGATMAEGFKRTAPMLTAAMAGVALPEPGDVAGRLVYRPETLEGALPELEQRIRTVMHSEAFEQLREGVMELGLRQGAFAVQGLPTAPPPQSAFGGAGGGAAPVAGQAAAPREYVLKIEEGAITMHVPGGDAREIADGLRGELANQWRSMVEEADTRLRE